MKGQNKAFMDFKMESKFSGYNCTNQYAKVIAVFGNGVVLDETPFYAFSGGQLCDKGTLNEIPVIDVIKMPNGQHLHILEENPFTVGDMVFAEVDKDNRNLTRKNHSAAHLFQSALQAVVGSHAHQQGSQVCSEYCRFDFNNYNALTDEEIIKIEDIVNQYINEKHQVVTHVLPIEEAKKLGAMSLFSEKYGKVVRVVDMGVSKEFCAGTHVDNTSEVEKFEIYNVESIGSGVFRMQAATSNDAMKYVIASQKNILDTIEVIKAKAEETINKASKEGIELKFNYNEKEIDVEGYRYVLALKERLQAIQNASKELEKEYMQKKSSQALKGLDQFDSLIESNKLLVKVDTTDINVIKDMASALKNNKGLDYVLLASVNGEKVTFVCAAKEPFNASLIVKEATKITGGGGGGKPDMAQAGGKDPSKVLEALAHVKEVF